MALPQVVINLEPVVFQRVDASLVEERVFIVNPLDINGNVIPSMYVEVVTEFNEEEQTAFASVVLPEISSLKGNSNVKITEIEKRIIIMNFRQ